MLQLPAFARPPDRLLPASATTDQAGIAHGRFWIAVSAVLFGAMAVVTRAASHELGAAQIAFIRFALGLMGVGVVTFWKRDLFKATRLSGLALRGIFGGGAVLGYFMAIERLSAGLGTLLNYIFPLWATLFAAAVLGEKLTIRVALGMAVAMTGLVIVVGTDEISTAFHGLGDPRVRVGLIAGLTSSVLGGAATTTVRALRKTESALAIFGAFCGVGMLVCLPMALSDWRPISPRVALLLLIIGTLSFGAQFLFTYSLKFVTAGVGSLTTQLTVVSSYGFAALFLGETVSLHALVGAAVVMAGVVIVSLSGRTAPPQVR